MTIRKLNSLTFMAVLLFAAVVFLPADAWAANDIFTTISQKMISTVKDIRQIVYIIAGFGLIMFAVLAVFNKISFKHLAYIMISLSLLAVMTPFINYFSGAGLDVSDLNYGNYIMGGDANITGSDITTAANCTGSNCPTLSGQSSDEIMSDLEKEMAAAGGVDMVDHTTAWDSSGCRTVTANNQTTQECCQGKIKNGKCKKTTKQLLKSIVQGGQQALNTVQNAKNAVDDAKRIYDTAKDTVDKVGDVIHGDGNLFDKLGDIADVGKSAGDTISSSVSHATNSVDNAMNSASDLGRTMSENYENNPTGDNKFSDKMDNSKVHDVNESIRNKTGNAQDEVVDYGNIGSDVSQTGTNASTLGKDIGSWFGGKK